MFRYSPKQESVLNSRTWDHLSPGCILAFLATVGSGWKHSLEVGVWASHWERGFWELTSFQIMPKRTENSKANGRSSLRLNTCRYHAALGSFTSAQCGVLCAYFASYHFPVCASCQRHIGGCVYMCPAAAYYNYHGDKM